MKPPSFSYSARAIAISFFVWLAIACTAFGQTNLAELTGVVTDQSGAVVAGAQVTVTNVLTGIALHAPTNNIGLYTVTNLAPGVYLLQVQKTGFETLERSNIQLGIGQVARINATLSIGGVSQKVEVSGEPPLLQTQDSSMGGSIESQQLANLPVLDEDPYQNVFLLPGVMPQSGPSGGYAPRIQAETSLQTFFTVNGSRPFTNEILIDGTPNVVAEHGQLAFTPSEDTVEQFHMLSGTFSAAYGRTGGGVLLMATKSGTNSFHGTLYEFLRNDVLDANNYFSNQQGIPRSPYQYNDYGGSIGGPVWLPHLYNGHNRSFFFFSFDGQKLREHQTFLGTVPTLAQRSGDFSNTENAQGQLITIYDPATTQQVSPGVYSRTPFSGNKIPASRLDPVAVKATSFYPLPNRPGISPTGIDNYATTGATANDLNTYDARFDQNFGQHNRMFFRFSRDVNTNIPANFYHNIATSNSVGPGTEPDYIITLGDTHDFTSNLLLDLRGGYTQQGYNRTSESAGFDYSELGFPAAMNNELQTRQFPTINISGLNQLGPYAGAIFKVDSNIRSLGGTLTYIHGRHNLSVGVEWRVYELDDLWYLYGNGDYFFNAGFTQGPSPTVSSSSAGLGYASFLLGAGVNGLAEITPAPAFANKYFATFLQDDFHATQKLTLNLGLRYDYESPRTDRFNHLSFFNPTLPNPIGSQVGMPNLKGGLEFVGVNGNPRGQANPDLNNFGPRFGFEYSLTPRIVVRGGYAITYLPNGNEHNFNTGNDGFSATTTQLTQNPDFTVAHPLSNPFPSGLVQPTGSTQGPLTLLGQSIGGFLRRMPVPYAQQYNLNLQWQPGAALMEAAYSGSLGVDLPITKTLNQLPDSDLSMGSALLNQVSNPFYGIVKSGPLSTPKIQAGQLLRPFPQFNGINYTQLPGGSSSYNSLLVRGEIRNHDGLTIAGAYTWSKLISDVWAEWGYSPQLQDSNNLRAERSVDPQNIPQRLVINGVYSLPFGHGRRWLGSANGIMAKLAEGWTIAGIEQVQSGEPLGLTTNVNNINAFTLSSRPNTNGQSPNLSHPTLSEWFNTSAFSAPPPFTFGNVSRMLPHTRSDAAKNVDLSLIKSTQIRENLHIAFHADAFNVFNRPQFGIPGTALGTPQFGVVTNQANAPREIQVALKIMF